MSASTRYTDGLAKLEEIDGEAGRKVIDSLQAIAPDLARYVIEFPFGDIYQRPGLDLPSASWRPWRRSPRSATANRSWRSTFTAR